MWLSIVLLAVLLPVVCCNRCQSHGSWSNTFLKSKWKMVFNGTDVNHDGVLSMTDLQELTNKFSDLNHSYIYKTFDKWWNECVVRDPNDKVTEPEFVDAYDQEFTMDKKKFHSRLVTCTEMFVDVLDVNQDNKMCEEEFLIVMKAFGHTNDVANINFFQSYKPVDGLVPLGTFLNSWVDFATNNYFSKENEFKTAYESGA